MIRLILFVVVGLLAGLGAGTGFTVVKAKSAFAAESERRAKVVADSVAEHADGSASKSKDEHATPTVAPDSASVEEPLTDAPIEMKPAVKTGANVVEAPAVSHDATPAKAAPVNAAKLEPTKAPPPVAGKPAPVAGASTPTRTPVTSAASKGEDVAQPKRIAKIFASMPPTDAAKVLVQMDDTDVQLILGALGEKEAAAILRNFPAERAAALTKSAIRESRTP